MNNLNLQKLPPQNIDAEQMVLGAILIENDAINNVSATLTPEDFYKEVHRRIYTAMIKMFERREAIDLVTLTDELRGKIGLEAVGGASYLATLVSLVPTAANIKYHAKIVSEKSRLRSLIHIASEAIEGAYAGQEFFDAAAVVIDKLSKIRSGGRVEVRSMSDVINMTYDAIYRRSGFERDTFGIPTGIQELDRLTDGLYPGEITVVAGRPSMGKTSFAQGVLRHAAGKGHKVGMINLEMLEYQLGVQEISSLTGIPVTRLRTGKIYTDEWNKIHSACDRISKLPYALDFSSYTDKAISRSIDHMVQDRGCELIVLDYLQLSSMEQGKESREREVATISRMLKQKAKQHNVPIMPLSQLNRKLEDRTDKRPMLADLRESGAIEQDADAILFLYREEVYNKCSCSTDGACLCERRGKAEIIVAKGRNTGTADIPVMFNARTTTFYNSGVRPEEENKQ